MARVGKLLVERLHKAFVLTCIATTVVGLGVIGVRAGNYFIYVYPQAQALKKKEEESLLLEGKAKDLLPDTTPNIRE